MWEEVWRSTTPEPKELLQGLIQVAVGMVHHRDRGRPAVARRVLAKGRRRVEPYAPAALGLDLDALLASVDGWSRWLEHHAGERRRCRAYASRDRRSCDEDVAAARVVPRPRGGRGRDRGRRARRVAAIECGG